MQLFQISEATAEQRRILVYLVDDTDGKTPVTGVTISTGDAKISKNGAAEVDHEGTLTELGGGLYYYEFTTGEVDTLGFISLRLIKTGVRTFVTVGQVDARGSAIMTRLGAPTGASIAADIAAPRAIEALA